MPGKVFISYNHADADIVKQVSSRLAIEFGKENIFFDEWSIKPGDSIIGKMNDGLSSFTTFFFFVSEASLESGMVSLEWQAALNRAVTNDLKFVAVRVFDCKMPAILSDRLYIDLYNDGIDSAISKMKDVVGAIHSNPEIVRAPNFDVSLQMEAGAIRVVIEAMRCCEQNPVFAFASSNPVEDYDVCFNISDTYTVCHMDEIMMSDGITLSARVVTLQRAMKPGFPFIFGVYPVDGVELRDMFLFRATSLYPQPRYEVLWRVPWGVDGNGAAFNPI